jgi:carboxyl-terminal processing protease
MKKMRITRCCLFAWLTLSFAVFVIPAVRAAENAQPSAPFGGIGASIQMEGEGAVYPTVVGVLPGGAAAKSGIGAGDRLVGIVDEGGRFVDFQVKSFSEIIALIRGPSGSTLRLVVEPKGSGGRKLYELIREIIKPPPPEPPR